VETLAARLKRKAAELGFCKVGIVPAEDLAAEGEALREWLAAGHHGEMRWMEREPEKRSDPRLIVLGARPVVALAMNYFTPHRHELNAYAGKISRYAWGDDYHDVLRERLNVLLDWVRAEVPGANGKASVDTAPILEKAWAARAGLGWIGKHSNLITKDHGSWVFLGELILDIELEYDRPEPEEHCGTCTACLDACPTGAIVKPYVVDSSQCISYATIELRDEKLPGDVAANLKGWLYGCDICQEVCPWNLTPSTGVSSEPAWLPRMALDGPALLDLWRMTDEELRRTLKGSAMKRAGVRRLRRNLAVAVGNSGDPEAAAQLEASDEPTSRDPMVARHVRWAASKLRG
jgi:epoxyqueuosine reductase